MAYRLLYDRVLRRLDAETSHALALRSLRAALAAPPAAAGVSRLLAPDPCLRLRVLGLDFATPLGVAAGLDKGATAYAALGRLGFGSVEVGTVTARAQPGNPRPRVFRLPAEPALLNRMGFPNPGAAVVAGRLARPRGALVVGVNVGRTKTAADAVADIRASLALVAPLADYLVLNVSSPNTPGVRDLQAPDRLEELVAGTRDLAVRGGRPVPLLVKLGPDLTGGQLDAVAEVALRAGLDGIVATNTVPTAGGGISGGPLRERALAVLRHLHDAVGGRVALVSAGGILDAEDAWGRILAGAVLVQAYTGFVLGGPLWPARVNRELARRVRAEGAETLPQLVGAAGGVAVHRGVEGVEKSLLMAQNGSH